MTQALIIECPQCGADVDVDFTPGRPARTNCRNEDASPEQYPEWKPEYCPECGSILPEDDIKYQANPD